MSSRLIDEAHLDAAGCDDGLCLGCDYPLRGLSERRCPECGRAFDPDDPESFNPGRPVPRRLRPLMAPMSARVRGGIMLSCLAIIWGAAWLPGGFGVEFFAWYVLLCLAGYRALRLNLRRLLRRVYRQRSLALTADERFFRSQMILLGLVAIAPLTWWPLRLSLVLQRPFLDAFAYDAYEVRPMLDPPATPRWVGLFAVDDVEVGPTGVAMRVMGANRLYWSARDPHPYVYRQWPHPQYLPWYMRRLLPPSVGRWSADVLSF